MATGQPVESLRHLSCWGYRVYDVYYVLLYASHRFFFDR